MTLDQLGLLPLWYAAFLLSVTCHEAAHAFAAHRGGDSTAYHGGQVTLNPVPHVQREIVGTVIVPLVSFLSAGWMMGWASAPYDPLWADRHPRRAAAMAAAGPAANLVLALVAFGAIKLGAWGDWWMAPDLCCAADDYVTPLAASAGWVEGLGRLLSVMLSLNLLLLLFNLIPLPPLDGASIVAGLVSAAAEPLERLRAHPAGAFAGILIAFLLFSRLPLEELIRDWVLYPGLYERTP